MKLDFRRVAIVNRGEPAVRLIHAVREFARETGKEMRTIAFFTEPDRHAMFVREADEAVALGEAFFVDPQDGQRKSSYLDYGRLQEALLASSAEAAWVGWGFVAEHPAFVELCQRSGVVFIGPSAEVMRKLGDKITAKRIAESARVPVAPWSGGPVDSIEEARDAALRVGFPLMIKATSGGGGRGIRRVRSMDELAEAFDRSRSEALRGFGDPTVFLERMVRQARHVEVQIIGDRYGTVWAAGVRDCSVQRRNQKVIEESASTALNSLRERKLRESAVRLCKAAGYFGAGTVEFLFDPRTREMAFMEVNARLQVEHPVTEVTTGLDLVKLQLHVAQGGRLEGKQAPRPSGHAIEVRLNAEDPDNGFAPSPGRVELFRPPTGPGVRVDTGIEEGDRIASEFDSMVAKIIAFGKTRDEAIARLERALSETTIVVRGGTTNKAFLLELLAKPEFRAGRIDITWLDRMMAAGAQTVRPHAEAALIQAAIEVYREDLDAERRTFLFSAYRGRPQVTPRVGSKVELRYRGNAYVLHVCCLGASAYRVEVDGARIDVGAEVLGRFERRLTMGGTTHRIVTIADGVDHLVEIDGVPHRVSRDDGGMVRSPAPAVVVALRVRVGDDVRAGDTIAVLEAMKTEMPVTAPFAGKVREIKTTANEQVAAGAPLMRIEAEDAEDTAPVGARLAFGALDASRHEHAAPRDRCIASLKELQRLALGYDVDPQTSRRLITLREELGATLAPDDENVLLEEVTLLGAFADVAYLSSRHPEPLAEEPGIASQSPQQSLFTFTRAIDAKGEGLPKRYVSAIERALKHYEITSLDRSEELESALVWIFKSHSRVEHQTGAIVSVLERLLRDTDALRPHLGSGFRELLSRVIAVSRGRFRSLEDLAREVRYAYFDKPLLEAARQRVYDVVIDDLRRLAREPDMEERGRLIARVVECPQPLLGLLTDHFRSADLSMRHLILETLARRYYRAKTLENVRVVTVEGTSIAIAETQHDGKRLHVHAVFVARDRIARLGPLLAHPLRDVPEDDAVALEIFARTDDDTDTFDALQAWAAATVDALALPRRVDRIVLSLTGFPTPHGPGQTHFTFTPSESGRMVEDPLYRGVHPLMAERIGLQRLSNFALQRLPSAEDVYLFLAVAKENPKDERLFALAEVRDLTPRRDRENRATGLPLLERMLLEACAAIRRIQSARPAENRLYMNRVVLHAFPPLDLGLDDLAAIARRLAPATSGLGIEKVVLRASLRIPGTAEYEAVDIHLSNPGGRGIKIQKRPQADRPVRSLTPYRQKVVTMQRRGLHYPYEIVRMLTPSAEESEAEFPPGTFVEHELGEDGHLHPVDRAWGQNSANIVVGTITNHTAKHPEGMTRVILLGDPSRSLGSLAEPECRRILAALDLAEQMRVPLEWFAVSAGAKISMQSGTENMDWIALVLRRLVLYTQQGGEVNIVVHGVNVGAQPYWNAEATMLMHTKGILVMLPEGAMVLTGKKALDYSGGVSAEDNHGIGGYDRVMGPNGQAQYWARDIAEGCHILMRHYDHTYVAPGERFPRSAATIDPRDRNVCDFPYEASPGSGFQTIGEVFSPERNPGRKRPFEIRRVMRATIDQDHEPLERWSAMAEAEIAVIWDAHLGGRPVCMLGFESRPVPRAGLVPADGPDAWSAGTLFPKASKKIARALNGASRNRPVVVLANLSGFDGSPESMRNLQLEYGAEIGRAVVNFEGPIVFSVISRYHGGAFVVFSRLLNESMEVSALEHTYASVIGGAPAAAVVFAGDVEKRTKADARVKAAEDDVRKATGARRAKAQARLEEVYKTVHSEKLGEVAQEFDTVHSVERALQVGSIQSIVDPTRLRPYLIEALERGIAAEIAREPGPRPFPDWRRASVLSASRGDDSGSKRTETAKDKPVDKPGPTRAPARRGDARDN